MFFARFDVMYSGEYNVFLCYSKCISTPGRLKLDHRGSRTRDLGILVKGKPLVGRHAGSVPKSFLYVRVRTKITYFSILYKALITSTNTF